MSVDTVFKRATSEHWRADRDKVSSRAAEKVLQKTANAVAENATIAEDLKKRLLLRLQRIEQKYPFDATEVRERKGDKTAIFRIRDLTAAYRDLTDDMPKVEADKNAPIYELLRRLDDECI